MRTTTVGDVKVLLPDLEPDGLDTTTNLGGGITEALVNGAARRRSVAFSECTLTNGAWSSCRLPRIALRSCDLAGLELDSCQLDGTDLRGSRLQGLKTPLDNLRGVTVGEDQLPDLTRLTVAALDLTVRND
ncbi:pentapeptide repeat-containing protein [Micromonospora sp. WMMD1155]|uniref:pentapeptide repeat-containing protein n=1 Tax=Micromonospora sp. WMMD1155 TaxID=3016094 RepID=UPI00249B69FA|nr:pentapeptide repeat-containing protein [Micromonospora sp. WMMD1155]WFE49983.1 hypothetical protein O7617_06465 [Micromonospora sp. WMMD1155]